MSTYFQTIQSIAALYLAQPDVTWKLVLAVCFGTGTLITTPSANILAPKTLFTCKLILLRPKQLCKNKLALHGSIQP